MKYYIIAGEASGDLHGSNLIKELKNLDSKAAFRCWGGDLMEKQGGVLARHYRDLAFMGFTEVVMNLGKILSNLKFCKKDIQEFHPDVVILIDYPGFNLRIAEYVKSLGTKVFYYISPQVWAWKESRVKIIKRCVDRMFVILPFEKVFYKKHHFEVDFTGHPLLDAMSEKDAGENKFRTLNNFSEKPILAILPGSRQQEIKTMLPVMIRACRRFEDFECIVAGAPSVSEEFYRSCLTDFPGIRVVFGQTYGLLRNAHSAVVTSGTATLETALFDVPEIVCYKGGTVSYHIARSMVKVKYISLVNLIMDREIVPELIQRNFNANNLANELKKIISGERREIMKRDYSQLKNKLGGAGASAKTAELMMKYLS